jgi:hypothetical protein
VDVVADAGALLVDTGCVRVTQRQRAQTVSLGVIGQHLFNHQLALSASIFGVIAAVASSSRTFNTMKYS